MNSHFNYEGYTGRKHASVVKMVGSKTRNIVKKALGEDSGIFRNMIKYNDETGFMGVKFIGGEVLDKNAKRRLKKHLPAAAVIVESDNHTNHHRSFNSFTVRFDKYFTERGGIKEIKSWAI